MLDEGTAAGLVCFFDRPGRAFLTLRTATLVVEPNQVAFSTRKKKRYINASRHHFNKVRRASDTSFAS